MSAMDPDELRRRANLSVYDATRDAVNKQVMPDATETPKHRRAAANEEAASPPAAFLEQAAAAEDTAGSVSVGGLAAQLGLLVSSPPVMKLWKLELKPEIAERYSDVHDAFVVRAADEGMAVRLIELRVFRGPVNRDDWTVSELPVPGEPEIVVSSFR